MTGAVTEVLRARNDAHEGHERARARAVGALGQGAPVLTIVLLPHETVREAIARLGAQLGIGHELLDMSARTIVRLAKRSPR